MLEAGTTDNGVFACEVIWGVLPNFLRQLDHRAGADLDGDPAFESSLAFVEAAETLDGGP